MSREDRKNWPVRIFKLGDPEAELAPEYAKLTPGERFALVFEATRRCVAMQGINWDDQRLQRHVVRVERRRR
jgi:hypothetical protein